MALNQKQQGVLKGMLIGLALSLALITIGITINTLPISESRNTIPAIQLGLICALVPALFLTIAIGRLAKHRFFYKEDIDARATKTGTQQASVLQAIIQNTLEQFSIATLVYIAWAVLMPSHWLNVIPLAATAFAIGRILFFMNYRKGAAARAFGFAITFYPSVLMLITLLVYSVSRLA